jgi:hypothetical protein
MGAIPDLLVAALHRPQVLSARLSATLRKPAVVDAEGRTVGCGDSGATGVRSGGVVRV